MHQAKKTNIDMINGPILSGMIRYAIPVMLASIMSLIYNSADLIVVGKCAETVELGKEYLAAVSASSAIITFLSCFTTGLSMGSTVRTSKLLGEQNVEKAKECTHTAVLVALIIGTFIGAIGVIFAKPFLSMTNCPEQIFDNAAKYLMIYLCGCPFHTLYTFLASQTRAMGDSKTPFWVLTVSGIINIFMNLFAVLVLKMGVAGVALATVASQTFSAVIMVIFFLRKKNPLRIEISKLRIHMDALLDMMRIGIPASVASILFSLSKVFIQAVTNSFPMEAIAGTSVQSNLATYEYVGITGTTQACLVYISSNFGAKKPERIKKIVNYSILLVTAFCLVVSALIILLRKPLISIFNTDPEVIRYAGIRIFIVTGGYFACGLMNVGEIVNHGLNHSMESSILSLVFGGGFRVLYVFTICQWFHEFWVLCFALPISWVFTFIVQYILYRKIIGKFEKELLVNPSEVPAKESFHGQ